MGKRYFHEFRTIDYRAAVAFYKANKFTLWQEENGEGDGEGGQVDTKEDDQAKGKGAIESESKEKREADSNVQDQDNGARREDDDTKDNGDGQDDLEEHVKSNQCIVNASCILNGPGKTHKYIII